MKVYWITFSSVIFIGLFPITFSYPFLKNVNEIFDLKDIVEKQIETDAIFGPAYNMPFRPLHVEALMRKVKPKVLALGSSRVMNLRSIGFNTSFINGGGTLSSVSDLKLFIEHYLSKLEKPELIILQVDYWWFINFIEKINFNTKGEQVLDLKLLYQPYRSIYAGELKWSYFLHGIQNKIEMAHYYKKPSYGLAALLSGLGFRKDGSLLSNYVNLTNAPGKKRDFSKLYENHAKDFRTYNGRPLREFQKKLFINLLNELKLNNYNVIIQIPPVATKVIQNMLADHREEHFLEEFNQFLTTINEIYPVYNYHDFRSINDDDCEFVDGFHGGELTALRILKEIALKNSDVRKYVDLNNINNLIPKHHGKAFIFNNEYNPNYKELDFLKIGCQK